VKRALITGVNGQDGSYLAEMLLAKGYEVHGVVRRDALEDPAHRLVNIAAVRNDIHLHTGSLDNDLSLYKIAAAVRPDECYHLASSSFVSYSFEDEVATGPDTFAIFQGESSVMMTSYVPMGARPQLSTHPRAGS